MNLFIRKPVAIAIAGTFVTVMTPAFANASVSTSENITYKQNQDSLVGKHHFEVNPQHTPNATITIGGDLNITADQGKDKIYHEAHHGIYVGPSQNKAPSAPDLTLQFGTTDNGTQTTITVQNGGDTGILVDGFKNHSNGSSSNVLKTEYGTSYTGSVTFLVDQNSTLNVSNENIISQNKAPTSDAIELRVQDKTINGDKQKNNISVDFKGAGEIETKGGAGFYLLQSGQGNISVNLSEKVNITTDGDHDNTAKYHMSNHGINAVIQESSGYYSDQTKNNLNKGTINIQSGATIQTNGNGASAIYARNLSGNVNITTTGGTISANGTDSHGINVRGSEGDIVINNNATLKLNEHNLNEEAKTGASGIEVLVGQLVASHEGNKYGYDEKKKYGNGTGTVLINNSGKIDAHGSESKGIHVKREAKVTTELPKDKTYAIDVRNAGEITLHKDKTHGIFIESQSVSDDKVSVTNTGALKIDGKESKGIYIDRRKTADVSSREADTSKNASVHVENSGNITLNGFSSIGIEVKNDHGVKESVYVSNTGHLTLQGGKTTGILVDNAGGDVIIDSHGIIDITKPTSLETVVEAQAGTSPETNLDSGLTFGFKAMTQNGNIHISSASPDEARAHTPALKISGANEARGLMAWVQGGTGNIEVVNTKNILIENGTANIGVVALRQKKTTSGKANEWLDLQSGDITIVNKGDITLSNVSGQSGGIVGWNEKGNTSISTSGNIQIDGSLYAAGVIAHSKDGNSLIIVANDKQGTINLDGEHMIGIRSHASGTVDDGGMAKASVMSAADLKIVGNNNKGIEVVADGEATIVNSGSIDMNDTHKDNSSIGLHAKSQNEDSYILHKGNIEANNLKYGIYAEAGEMAHILINGDINAKADPTIISDSFALKSEGNTGNVIQVKGNIVGAQAIKVKSGATATNAIDLYGTVKADNGYAIILDTASSTRADAIGSTTVINHEGATLYGQISGKKTDGETTLDYENRLKTDVINYGRWIVGHADDGKQESDPYNTTILGTQGDNSITNFGEMLMDPSLTSAVTWNQMGIRQFDNRGRLDLSSNKKAGDWLTITNNTDITTNFERSGTPNTAEYYKITDRTHSDKFNGVFLSNGGRFDLDINLGDDNTGFADVLIVDNVRLEGAPTVLSFINRRDPIPDDEIGLHKGIEVVHVRGTESNDAGAFVLGTTLTLNGYQYILEQDKEDKNWYIRNYLQDAGGPGEKLIDPNAGAYLAGAWLNARVFNHNLYDRRDSSWNKDKTVWARIEHNDGEGSFFNDVQRSNLWSNVVQAGADIYKKEDYIAGLFAAYGRTKADNNSPMTNTTARIRADGYQIGAYWTYLPTYGEGAYVDLWGYWAWFNNKMTGHAVNGHTVKFDSSGFALSAETGYSWQPNDSRFTVEPHVQVIYSRFRAEQANLEGTPYGGGKTKGFQTRVGARFFYDSIPQPDGVKLTPMLEANWLYNDAKDVVNAGPTTLDSDLGRHVGELKLGWQGSMRSGWTSWGHVGLQRGADNFRNLELQLGLGYKF